MVRLGEDFKSFKDDTQYKNSQLSIRSFLQQEEQKAFFCLSPANQDGHRTVVAHIPAFVPEPTQEVRSLLPYVDWQQQLPYNPEQAFPTADDPLMMRTSQLQDRSPLQVLHPQTQRR